MVLHLEVETAQALQKWYKDKPELFVKNVYDQPGLDTACYP
jgi:hypothetical protein